MGSEPNRDRPDADHRPDEPNDLDRLVSAILVAHERQGSGVPRRPWLEPLPDSVVLDDLAGASEPKSGWGVPIGLADEPRLQRQTGAVWEPARGNAVLIGMTGSGTTTALTTIACSFARRLSPSQLHIYGVDHGAGGLRDLEALPHVGSIIDAGSRDRQLRLIGRLDDERRRRAALPLAEVQALPRILVLVDGYGSWRTELESDRRHDEVESFVRVYADGPGLGIHCALSGDHIGAVDRQLQATTDQTWLFKLGDPADYLAAGMRVTSTTAMPPGRAFRAGSGREVQFALAHADGLDAAVQSIAARSIAVGDHDLAACAPAVGELPVDIAISHLGAEARLAGAPCWIPVGVGNDHLSPVGFELFPGEHALIAGRARTGKSTALCAIARVLVSAGAHVVGLAPSRSPLLRDHAVAVATSAVADVVAAVSRAPAGPTVLLVDDADCVDDPAGHLAGLVDAADRDEVDSFHLIVAGRTDRLLGTYGHWSSAVRSSRVGVLLCPEPLDGDLFGVQLPPRCELPALPGRGWFVAAGSLQVCQLASVATTTEPGSPSITAMRPSDPPARTSSKPGDQRSRATRSA